MELQATDPAWMHLLSFVGEMCKIFLSAFLGAWCAFNYERRRKNDEERSQRTTSLRDALFAVQIRLNGLLIIHKQYLKAQERNPNRWVELSPILQVTNPPRMPIAELSFLLDAFDPMLLRDLVVAGEKFDTVCAVVSTRNRTHEEFQRFYEQGQASERLHAHLTRMTDSLYDLLPDAASFLLSVHERVEKVICTHFSGTTCLGVTAETKMMIDELQPQAGGDGKPAPWP